MSRSRFKINYSDNSVDEIQKTFEHYMNLNGYKEKLLKNERVWLKGDGVITLMQCFRISYGDKAFTIEAWTKDALFGESELEGFSGWLIKSKMKDLIQEMISSF